MSQERLFEFEAIAVKAGLEVSRESETDTDSLSRMGDKRRVRRLSTIADRLQRATHPLDRAKLATEARDLAEALVEETILEANQAGVTWREIGAGLGVPFQTVYRRYGANR
jgi:DNA invertase Pin-like site-specific DNA recombinase